MLKANKVHQQQTNLRMKNELEKARKYLPGYYDEFQETKNQCVELQKVIFDSKPFELKQK